MSQNPTYTNKRSHAIALIEAGNCTKETLLKELDVNDKTLASVFSQLRLTGKYPMKHEDGVYFLGTEEEFAAARNTRTSGKASVERSPKEVLDAAVKREDRASKVATTAEKRYADDPSRENELRKDIAIYELELSSILLGKAQSAYNAADPATRDLPTKSDASSAEMDACGDATEDLV